jgi:hypothetical protein
MKHLLLTLTLCALAPAWAAEPLVGTWQMISQTMNGSNVRPLPIAIKITQASATSLTFTYVSGREEQVKMAFTVRLNGTAAPIINETGAQIGTARLTKSGDKYELVLQRPGRPPEPGTLVLSDKNLILTCSSETMGPDRVATHIVQQFARQ